MESYYEVWYRGRLAAFAPGHSWRSNPYVQGDGTQSGAHQWRGIFRRQWSNLAQRHLQHCQHDQTQRFAFTPGDLVPGVFYGDVPAEERVDGGG